MYLENFIQELRKNSFSEMEMSQDIKEIDGDPHKRWSMWFNSKQREEPYLVLTSF